jgi:signal transduction histidine kinase
MKKDDPMSHNDNQISILTLTGVFLLILGILFPNIVEDWSTYMIENIEESILLKDGGKLVITSIVYMTRYCFVFFFIFFGAILVSDGMLRKNHPYRLYMYACIVLVTIIVYNYLHQEYFSYIGHLLTLSLLLFLQNYIPKRKNYYVIYSIVLLFVLMAMSWMQLIPALTKFGLGTNDLASSLKIADHYLTNNYLFNTLASILFVVFLVIPIILTFLVHLLNKQILTMEKIQENESELKAARIALVESKVYEEVNSLVHDLKTPLSTIEGLSSLIKMRLQTISEISIDSYIDRMGGSIQKMNDMISEILYEDIKQPISPKELIEYVTSHLILAEQSIEIDVNIEEDIPSIYVNKIRFSRAISNILENAIASLAGKAGVIQVAVKKVGETIVFQFLDNGQGIEASHLQDIWEDGFSTKNSSGIGLSFVKAVVENHQGTIQVNSVPGSFTQVTITLPVYEKGEKADEYHYLSR